MNSSSCCRLRGSIGRGKKSGGGGGGGRETTTTAIYHTNLNTATLLHVQQKEEYMEHPSSLQGSGGCSTELALHSSKRRPAPFACCPNLIYSKLTRRLRAKGDLLLSHAVLAGCSISALHGDSIESRPDCDRWSKLKGWTLSSGGTGMLCEPSSSLFCLTCTPEIQQHK